jgi:hypothetical protein
MEKIMSFDFNSADPQMVIGDLIPDGTFAKLRLSIRPGGVDGAVPMDQGLLKASGSSDAKMLDSEFTVMEGPYAKRKFWQMFTVQGGKLDEKGQSKAWNISKSAFRAMIDSALGLNPEDMSEAAKAKRVIQGLKQLDGITFWGRIMIEPASNPQYRDVNRLANVVTPADKEYAVLARGEQVPPHPVGAKARPQAATPGQQSLTPAWANKAAPPAQSHPQPQQQAAAKAAGPAWLNG